MKSHYRGVSWHSKWNLWQAQISIDNKVKHLGYFKSEKEAADCFKKHFLKREASKLKKCK